MRKGETARELWERALAPMGLSLLARVVRHAQQHGALPAQTQDIRFATRAPMTRRAVVLSDDPASTTTSLVFTVMGNDRPGIVKLLSHHAQRFCANWTDSRMARLAGEFAGMVHFEVPRENADALAAALRTLDSSGLHVAIAQSSGSAQPGIPRGMGLELVGNDRPAIVANLTRLLAEHGVSIENLHTELIGGAAGAGHRFKVAAHLLVPPTVSSEDLRRELGTLASEMMLDIALGERPPREA